MEYSTKTEKYLLILTFMLGLDETMNQWLWQTVFVGMVMC